MDKGNYIDVFYMDIAKAFDSCSHSIIGKKLGAYGFCGNLLNWLKAFLSDRKQRVVIDNEKSDIANVTSGVPRGSSLGPLLFLLYINDLPQLFENDKITLKMFADDCKLYISVPKNSTDVFDFEAAINKVYDWCKDARLSLALQKCSVLHLGYANPSKTYGIENTEFENVTEMRDLGILVGSDHNKNISFSSHCRKIASNASVSGNLILKAFTTKNRKFLTNMYKTFVRPKLEYASSAWNPFLVKDKNFGERPKKFYIAFARYEAITRSV